MNYTTIKRLLEDREPIDLEHLATTIRDQCKPWLEVACGNLIYRGFKTPPGSQAVRICVRQDRKPLTSSTWLHDKLNEAIAHRGLKANRSNSLFCTSSQPMASSYGTLMAVFPLGQFHYTYSPTTRDWYTHVTMLPKSAMTGECVDLLKPLYQGNGELAHAHVLEIRDALSSHEYNSDRVWQDSKLDNETGERVRQVIAKLRDSMEERISELAESLRGDDNSLCAFLSKGPSSKEVMITCEHAIAVDNRIAEQVMWSVLKGGRR